MGGSERQGKNHGRRDSCDLGIIRTAFSFYILPNTRHQSSTWTAGVHFIITPGDCDWTGLGFGLLLDRLAGKANASEISFSFHSRELGGFGLTWPGGNGAKTGHLHGRSVWLSFFSLVLGERQS